MTIIRWALSGLLAVAVCGASAASAQGRPYRSLFGGAANEPDGRHVLDLSVSLTEAYDTNVLATEAAGAAASALQVGGLFTGLSADLRYMTRRNRAQFAVNLGSNVRYFQEAGELAAMGQSLGLGASVPLGQKTTLVLNESVSYMPSYLYGLFAKALTPAVGDAVPLGTNYGLNDRRSFSSATTAYVTRTIGRRSSLDVHSSYRNTNFSGPGSNLSDFVSYDVGARLGYPVGRDLVLRLGYSYRGATYSLQRRPVEHDIGLGFDYNRPLSRSRRTRLGLNVGSSVFEAPPPGQPVGPKVRHLRASANVLLSHQMGRTWSSRLAYRRGAQFVEELSAPVFTDAVTLNADGFVNRRTDLSAALSYSKGDVYERLDSAFEMYTGTVRVRYGITRTLAAYSEYLYYFYDFNQGVPLITDAPSRVDRHGVRIGLTLWVPIFRN